MSAPDQTRTVALPQGTIRYRDLGSGEPIVFVHGYLVNGRLWGDAAARLDGFRRIIPDLPLGSHPIPMAPDADLTPPGVARLVADMVAELGLERVTLVGNDTGGAICQLVITRHPERLSRLVLTNCDAFENFPPRGFRLLPRLARIPGALTPLLQPARLKTVRRLTYRPFARRRLDDDLLDSWVRPFLSSAEIRRDTTKVTVGIDRRHTLEAGRRLSTFEGEALIAWARRDPFFPFSYAERLAEALPAARLEAIEDSRAFVPLDQPARLAELISAFARS